MTKEEKKIYMKKYKETHKEDIKKYNKKYKEYHVESTKMYNEKYRIENQEYIILYQENYNKKNAERKREYSREYSKKNSEARKVYQNKHRRERKKVDPAYKILCNIRGRISEAVNGTVKSAHTIELIGCSIEELLIHLESKFQEGMTFENYGKWHVDHIRPCASFNFMLEEEQKVCFHYSNLQPLWAIDNLRKGDKWEFIA